MKTVVAELRQIIHEFTDKIDQIPDSDFSDKLLPGKWSKKEVLGHLIDSAENNLRRFITGQYESVPPKIVYDQDFWVTANGYQRTPKADIISLWKLINERICEILLSVPVEKYNAVCDTGKEAAQHKALEWLAADYVKHMKHHLNQIIPGSFTITYP
ncbi:MAG TPA: DinB family protein [Ohtaekwangia sp.]